MSSQTVKERGTRDLHRPGIAPDQIVTILDPRHPRHEARNPSEYVVGNEIFDGLVKDWMSSVGFCNAPRAAWVVTDRKTKAGYWLAVDGSKRIEAARVGNRLLVEAGGLAKDIAFDSDIGQDMNLTAVKGIASQYTRAIESAYTTARDAATLMGRAWGGEETGNEAPIEAATDMFDDEADDAHGGQRRCRAAGLPDRRAPTDPEPTRTHAGPNPASWKIRWPSGLASRSTKSCPRSVSAEAGYLLTGASGIGIVSTLSPADFASVA